jgi:hypothetical protein
MKAKLINSYKEWNVISITPMIAIDFEDKCIRIAFLMCHFEVTIINN